MKAAPPNLVRVCGISYAVFLLYLHMKIRDVNFVLILCTWLSERNDCTRVCYMAGCQTALYSTLALLQVAADLAIESYISTAFFKIYSVCVLYFSAEDLK